MIDFVPSIINILIVFFFFLFQYYFLAKSNENMYKYFTPESGAFIGDVKQLELFWGMQHKVI